MMPSASLSRIKHSIFFIKKGGRQGCLATAVFGIFNTPTCRGKNSTSGSGPSSRGFGYVLLSALPDRLDACRLREGTVTAQRPQILTPDLWKKRFEGFGEEQADYQRRLERFYGDALRALEYTFRNNLRTASIEQTPL